MNPVLKPQLVRFMHKSLKTCEYVGMHAITLLSAGLSSGVSWVGKTTNIFYLANLLLPLESKNMLELLLLVARDTHKIPTISFFRVKWSSIVYSSKPMPFMINLKAKFSLIFS